MISLFTIMSLLFICFASSAQNKTTKCLLFYSPARLSVAKINQTAGAIINNIRSQELLFLNKDTVYKIDLLGKQVQLVIFFNADKINSIKRRGFLNTHQTQTSRGWFDPKQRLLVEDVLASGPLGDSRADLYVRPKSVFVEFDANLASLPKIDYSDTPHPYTYGRIGAVLKHEIKKRSVWTYGDSLEVGNALVRNELPIKSIHKFRGTFFSGGLPEKPEKSSVYKKMGMDMIEGLVFGTMTTNDVDHYIVFDKAEIQFFSDRSKPIFLVESEFKNGRKKRVYKEILNVGDSPPDSIPTDQESRVLNSWLRGERTI